MRRVIFLLLLFLSGHVCVDMDNQSKEHKEDKYTTKYDNIDIGDVIKNDRLLKSYVECLLGTRKCTPDGAELKRNMPDAIQTNCSKCSKKQKEGSEIIIGHLIDNKPEYWESLRKIYDSSGNYTIKYLEDKAKDNKGNRENIPPKNAD